VTVINRMLGLVLGLALLVAGVVTVVEVVAARLGRPPWVVPTSAWDQTLGALRWDVTVLVAMLVIGLVLLLLELWPRQPQVLPLQPASPDRTAAVDRRGLQEHLRQIVAEDPSVTTVRVQAGKRKVAVQAEVPPSEDVATVRQRLESRLTEALDRLDLQRPVRPTVQLDRGEERVR
jgi:hypothetical protein